MKTKRIRCAQCYEFFEDMEDIEPQFCSKKCLERYDIKHTLIDKDGFYHYVSPKDYLLINSIDEMRVLVYSKTDNSLPFIVDVSYYDCGNIVLYYAFGQEYYFGCRNKDYFKEWPKHWAWKPLNRPSGE